MILHDFKWNIYDATGQVLERNCGKQSVVHHGHFCFEQENVFQLSVERLFGKLQHIYSHFNELP